MPHGPKKRKYKTNTGSPLWSEQGRKQIILSIYIFTLTLNWKHLGRQVRAPCREWPVEAFPESPLTGSATDPVLGFHPPGNQVSLSKSADAFAFEEDSSSDGLSPDQTRSEDLPGSAGSPLDTKAAETPLAGPRGTVQVNRPPVSPSPLLS